MRYRWLMIVLLGALLLRPQPSAAQSDQISWEVTPGFNGVYRAGAWFPLWVTIANDGPDVRGTLVLRFRDSQADTFSQTIELPHSARKQLVLPIASDPNQSGQLNADLTLSADGGVFHQERILLNAQDSFVRVVGVISEQSGALPELANLLPPERGNGALVRFVPAELPDRPELLQTFNILFIQGVDTSAWSQAQRDALAGWVAGGGQLVVGGDVRVARGLSELLPAGFEESGDRSSLRSLGVGTGWQVRPDSAAVPVLRLSPAADAEVVQRGDNDLPLVVRRASGQGLVAQAAFGLESLRLVGEPAGFWRSVLRIENDQGWAWVDLRSRGRDVLEQAVQLPGLRLPSVLGLLGFMLLYILAVGPLNYLLLRRLQRREWAYLTIPLLVLLFSGGAYVWGSSGRGSATSVTQLSVVRAQPGLQRGQASTFMALFSPTRGVYNVQMQADVLLTSLERPWQRSGPGLDILFAESSVGVPDLLVDVGGVRTLSADHPVAVPQLEVRLSGQNQVTVRNRSDQPIEDVVLLAGSGATRALGTLAPGQQLSESLPLNETPVFNGSNGTIDRDVVFQQLLSTLSPSDFANGPVAVDVNGEPILPTALPAQAGLQPPPQLLAVGWQPQAVLPVTINGQQADAVGDTLYIWPVSKEQ